MSLWKPAWSVSPQPRAFTPRKPTCEILHSSPRCPCIAPMPRPSMEQRGSWHGHGNPPGTSTCIHIIKLSFTWRKPGWDIHCVDTHRLDASGLFETVLPISSWEPARTYGNVLSISLRKAAWDFSSHPIHGDQWRITLGLCLKQATNIASQNPTSTNSTVVRSGAWESGVREFESRFPGVAFYC